MKRVESKFFDLGEIQASLEGGKERVLDVDYNMSGCFFPEGPDIRDYILSSYSASEDISGFEKQFEEEIMCIINNINQHLSDSDFDLEEDDTSNSVMRK